MKRLYIISTLLFCTLIFGCKKDSVIEPNRGEDQSLKQSVFITMNIYNDSSAARSSYNQQEGIIGSAEYIIDKLRVYVFASDGTLDKVEVYKDLNADHIIAETIEVPKDLSKEIYFVANEPTELTTKLGKITTIDELKLIEFDIAEAMNGGFNGATTPSSDNFLIPMCAQYSVKNALIDLNIYVGLTRAVARVDLFLQKSNAAASRNVKLDSSTRLSATGITHSSKLFSGELSEPSTTKNLDIASSEITLSTTTPQRVLSFYTAERKYNLVNSSITMGVYGLIDDDAAINEKMSVTLGDDGSLTEINRNHVYRIYGSYNGKEIVAEKLDIMGWEDVEIDGEIEGVLIAVDNEVAMDWLRNGNTYRSKNISFGSNKPISFYLPVESNNSATGYEFKLYEFESMSAGSSYSLKDIALANNYIYATNWIESAMIHFTSEKTGYIEFVYTPVKVNYAMQSYPIRIKSDNVTAQMKAVYDNGYIPATLLTDEDWKKRAPGGVVFSKRGKEKHPVSTPEILHRDDDGYYRGDYKITAEEGTTYCEEKFGDGWYMPSYADMKEIAKMFDMLGVSYRFQNNGSADGSGELTESRYWSSSASSSSPGWYWSADFMSREYMNENLLEKRDGSESHFVRCLMDLQ